MSKLYRNTLFPVLLLVPVLLAACGGSSKTTPLSAAGATLANGKVGTAYSSSLTATGGTSPYTWAEVSGGALPGGLTLSSTGTVTGTPINAGTFGPYVFSVTDSKAATASTGSLSVMIAAAGAPTVTTTALADGTVGTAYSVTLAATGGTTPYTWAETSGGALPVGLTLTTAGVLAGTPTTAGTYGPYVFTVTDANNATAASASLTLKIDAVTAAVCATQGNESALAATTPYGFLLKGNDGNGNPIDIAGSFTPDGSGGITAASVDYNGFSNGPLQMTVDLTTSKYSFGTGLQGCLYLAFTLQAANRVATRSNPELHAQVNPGERHLYSKSAGKGSAIPEATAAAANVQFQFTLGQLSSSIYHSGRIIESDTATTSTEAAGFMYAQTPSSFSLANLQSNYAFGVDGWLTPNGTTLVRAAIAGTFKNSNGTLSIGYADYDEGGSVSGPLSGGSGTISATIDSATGRGTQTYMITTTNNGTLTFNSVIYMLNSSDFILMSTDAPTTSPLLAGRALAASATFLADPLSGSYLYTTEGYDTTSGGNFLQLGNLTATSNGAVTTATVYYNDSGTSGSNQYTNLSYAVDTTSGRGTVTGFGTAPPVAYLTASGSDDDIAGFIVGTDPQSSSGLIITQTTGAPGYTLASLNGTFGGSSDEDVDASNGAYLATLGFNGAAAYTITSPLTVGSPSLVPTLGTYTVNTDGSGTLDGGKFTFVTNSQWIYAIPSTGDPLLFVFVQGTTPQ